MNPATLSSAAAAASRPPLGVYIHFPWCARKCPYCDFNSHTLRSDLPERAYLEALLSDLDQELPRIRGRQVGSVFLGGGTPSLFSPRSVEALIAALRARVALAPDVEITLETNPGTVDQKRFAGYAQAGVNRLSLGVQSLDDELLRRIGRIHDAATAVRAVDAAHGAGFEHLNIDLMFGLPGQSPRQAESDLCRTLALNPDHVSYYQLTLEPNTLFHHAPPRLPSESTLDRVQSHAHQVLPNQGYTQYEVSAFARPGARCRHNMNYWRFGDYVGLGAGAHGKLTHEHSGTLERRQKLRHPAHYMRALASGESVYSARIVSREDIRFEFMLNGLRLIEGFSLGLFTARTGMPPQSLEPELSSAIEDGLLEIEHQRIRATPLGQRFLNDLIARFLTENPEDHTHERAD